MYDLIIVVQGIVAQVKDIFYQRESENSALRENLHNKNCQLDYLEKQTRDHAANLAKYGAHIEFNRKKLVAVESKMKEFDTMTFQPKFQSFQNIIERVNTGDVNFTLFVTRVNGNCFSMNLRSLN